MVSFFSNKELWDALFTKSFVVYHYLMLITTLFSRLFARHIL